MANSQKKKGVKKNLGGELGGTKTGPNLQAVPAV